MGTRYGREEFAALCKDTFGNPVPPFQVVRLFEGDTVTAEGVEFLGEDGLEQVKRRIKIDGLEMVVPSGEDDFVVQPIAEPAPVVTKGKK